MQSVFKTSLHALADIDAGLCLREGLIGLEKEALRVAPCGNIAQTPHPKALGCALGHPWITTDYSEALLEFITPPHQEATTVLNFLHTLHSFSYQHLGDELLWMTSMPCVLRGEQSIPVAYYGHSHAGRMKTIYRMGLGHRYGRIMQVIAGIHFNYSPAETFWQALQSMLAPNTPMRHFKDQHYFGMLRNLQRWGWLISYLFGASPAVCKSFLSGKPSVMPEFDESTYYEPYATSLRMGDIGYQNRKEEETGIKACYDDLDSYIRCLSHAIKTPCPAYEQIGIIKEGAYQQLNANILQIENEYYSTVRPKALLQGNERSTSALLRHGVSYIELRSLDVNIFEPLGVNLTQLHFLESFLLFCLLQESPMINGLERIHIDHNQSVAAHRGRDPALDLLHQSDQLNLRVWADHLLADMTELCAMMDDNDSKKPYSTALLKQRLKVENPDLTPSARMLNQMSTQEIGFHEYARHLSEQHQAYFKAQSLPSLAQTSMQDMVKESCIKQKTMEAQSQGSFEDYLAAYFSS